jgi:hypothetical protein
MVTSRRGAATEYTLDESNVVFGVNRTIEATNRAPGKVERMSVAVLVDDDCGDPSDDRPDRTGGGRRRRHPRRAGRRAGRDRHALRHQRGRPDGRRPGRADEAAAEPKPACSSTRRSPWPWSCWWSCISATAPCARRPSVGRRWPRRSRCGPSSGPILRVSPRPRWHRVSDAAEAHTAAGHALDLVSLNELIGGVGHRPEARPEPEPSVATEVAEMIDNQPEEVAQLLRGWLGDRRGATR